MKKRVRAVRHLSCVLFAAVASAAAAQPGPIRNHFDSDAAMRPPAFFDFAVLGPPGNADWLVMADANPPSAPNAVTQTVSNRPADSIAAALRRNVSLRDGRLSLAMKRTPGRGGIVFRMAGEKDFLVLLVDLASGDARLVSYRDGKSSELARGQAVFDMEWGTLAIELKGADVRATWGGKPLLSARDAAPVAGRAGMATAGPGNVTFDEFVIEPSDSAGGRR